MNFTISKNTLLLFFGVLSIFLLTNTTHAQLDETYRSKDVSLIPSPLFPGPHKEVRVTAQTFSFDVQTTELVWYVNGNVVKRGKGITEITITTGAIGTPTTIKVTATPPTVTTYEKTLTLWPSSLDVLWHTNTYTPSSYRGKALPVRGALVTISAFPVFRTNSGAINPKSLYYEWHVDNVLLGPQSGIGKQKLLLPITKSMNIQPRVSVRVYNQDQTITNEAYLTIPVRSPELYFYNLHPLRGPLYQRAIENVFAVSAGDETRILAEPYYTTGAPTSLQFQWKIENQNLTTDSTYPYILTYLSEAGSRGQQIINLEVTNPHNLLEQIRKSFQIHVE